MPEKDRGQGFEEKWNAKKLQKNTWHIQGNSAIHH